MCTVVLSLLFCQIQGKCLCKHRKVFTLLSSPIRLIQERGRSQKMISAGEEAFWDHLIYDKRLLLTLFTIKPLVHAPTVS